ncbi:hypothetical protein LCGC14_2426440 [marine sediment metagenome]|uniref:Methyl-accepting chemotaxis protein n=1 Tax=marine sediment metagenome TaxID=412755 RepID=A0A0F9EHB7_9ZZZZ|nr:hypothetical protein [bacterium]
MVDLIDRIFNNVNTQASFVEQTSASINQPAASINSVYQVTNKANSLAGNLVGVANEEIVGMLASLKNVSSGNREIVGELMGIPDKFKLTEEG